MRIAFGCTARLHELIPVFEDVESCNDVLSIVQRQVVETSFGIGEIEKLIADKMANLFRVECAMKEIVETRRRLDIRRVVNSYEIFRDAAMLFEVWRLSLSHNHMIYEQ